MRKALSSCALTLSFLARTEACNKCFLFFITLCDQSSLSYVAYVPPAVTPVYFCTHERINVLNSHTPFGDCWDLGSDRFVLFITSINNVIFNI